MTNGEDLQQRRRGYWLKLARERSRFTLAAAAKVGGLADTSGSTVSLWESGQRPIKVIQMQRLASAYGVPANFFLTPQETDDERLDRAIAEAAAFEREDWDGGPGGDQGGAGGPSASPRKRLS